MGLLLQRLESSALKVAIMPCRSFALFVALTRTKVTMPRKREEKCALGGSARTSEDWSVMKRLLVEWMKQSEGREYQRFGLNV